jgi:predicted nucleic acid-binding protein
MADKPKAIVLDSWAILAYLVDGPAGPQVANIIADAHANGSKMIMAIVNAGEVWYLIARKKTQTVADDTIFELGHLGIQFVDADWTLTREAANFKARHRMSYADCFAAALAKVNDADLVTGDPEFKRVEGEIGITWL